MAYSYYIDPEVNCVFAEHYGTFVHGDGFSVNREIMADPAYRQGMNILLDASKVTLPEEHTQQWYLKEGREGVQKLDKVFGHCRLAWVVGSAKDFDTVHRWKFWGSILNLFPN